MKNLNFSKLPYKGTDVPTHKSKDHIEKALKELGAQQIQWSEQINPPQVMLRVNFGNHVARFNLPVDDNEKHRRQVFRAYYWYFTGILKYVKFGIFEARDVFLPFTEVDEIYTVRDLITPDKLNNQQLLGPGMKNE